jgi:hypothetical protein
MEESYNHRRIESHRDRAQKRGSGLEKGENSKSMPKN